MAPPKQRLRSEETSTKTHTVRLLLVATVGVSLIVAVSVLAVLAENDLFLSEYKILLEAAATGLQAASGAAVALLTLTVIFNITITRVKRTFEKVYEVIVRQNPVVVDEQTEGSLLALLNSKNAELHRQIEDREAQKQALEGRIAELRQSVAVQEERRQAAETKAAHYQRLASDAASELQRVSAKLRNNT